MIGDPCPHCAPVGHSLGGDQDLCDHCNLSTMDKSAQSGAQVPAVLSSTQVAPGTPTTTILNADGNAIAWDVIEEESRRNGITAAASVFKVKPGTIQTRARKHKWKGIPDGRALAARKAKDVSSKTDTPGDFSSRIVAHRESIFKKGVDSLGKKKIIPIRNAKDFDIVDRIVRRAAGIDDSDPRNTAVLIHINEAIDAHGENEPIEATIVAAALPPDSTKPALPDSSEAGNQKP